MSRSRIQRIPVFDGRTIDVPIVRGEHDVGVVSHEVQVVKKVEVVSEN